MTYAFGVPRLESPGYGQLGRLLIPASTQSAIEREIEESRAAKRDEEIAEEASKTVAATTTDADEGGARDWPEPADTRSCVRVFDKSKIIDIEKNSKRMSADSDDRAKLKGLLRHLRHTGVWRTLPQAPAEWRSTLDRYEQKFPNFAAVISSLRRDVLISQIEGIPIAPAPLLLLGPPGVGKSLFAQTIARFFETPYRSIRMETAQSSSALCGSDAFWSNTRPGQIHELLAYGDSAAPVFFLDEIDKVSADRYSPSGPLYALLEKDSARDFHDLSVPWLKTDASHVIWICAANDVDGIPAPILSRLQVFDIPAPTPAQTRTIAANLFDDLRREWPLATAALAVDDAAFSLLGAAPPRLIKKALRDGVLRAIEGGRDRVLPEDVAAALPAPKTSSIGFLRAL